MSKNYIAQILEAKDSVFLAHIKHQNRFNDERKEALLRIKKSGSFCPEENNINSIDLQTRDIEPKYKTAAHNPLTSRSSYSKERPLSPVKNKNEFYESKTSMKDEDDMNYKSSDIPRSIGKVEEDLDGDSSSGDSKTSSLTQNSRKLSDEVKALKARLAAARRLRTSIDSVIAHIPSNKNEAIVNVTKVEEKEENIVTLEPQDESCNEAPNDEIESYVPPVEQVSTICDADPPPIIETRDDILPYSAPTSDLNEEVGDYKERDDENASVTSTDLSYGKQQVDRRAESLINAHQTKLVWFKKFVGEMEIKYEHASCEADIAVKETQLQHREMAGRMREEQLQLIENLECVMGELRTKQRRLNEEHAEDIGLIRLKFARASAKIEQRIFDIEVKFRADRHLRQKQAEENGQHLSKQHIEDMYSFKYDHSKQLNELHSELLKVKEESAEAQAEEVKKHRQASRELENITSEARETVSERIEQLKEDMSICDKKFEEEIRVIEQGVRDIYEELTDAVTALKNTQTTMRSELDDAIGSLKNVYEQACEGSEGYPEMDDLVAESDTAYDDDNMRDLRAAHDMEKTWGLAFSPVPTKVEASVKTPLQRPWAHSRNHLRTRSSDLNAQFERLVNNRNASPARSVTSGCSEKVSTPPRSQRNAQLDEDIASTGAALLWAGNT